MAKPRKVLLVENDEFTRYMMKEIITALDVEVAIAEDGQRGVDILRETPDAFGLVLMDLNMPDISGLEATRIIRESAMDPASKLPIVAVTSDTTYHDEDLCKSLGLNGFVTKPVTPGQLLGLIDTFCPPV